MSVAPSQGSHANTESVPVNPSEKSHNFKPTGSVFSGSQKGGMFSPTGDCHSLAAMVFFWFLYFASTCVFVVCAIINLAWANVILFSLFLINFSIKVAVIEFLLHMQKIK